MWCMCLLCIILTRIIYLLAYSHYLWIPSFRFIATTRYKLDYSSFGSQWNRYIFIFRYSEYFSYILLLLLYLTAYKCSSFVVDWQEQRICIWYFWPLCQTIIWFMFYSFIVLLVRLFFKAVWDYFRSCRYTFLFSCTIMSIANNIFVLHNL